MQEGLGECVITIRFQEKYPYLHARLSGPGVLLGVPSISESLFLVLGHSRALKYE